MTSLRVIYRLPLLLGLIGIGISLALAIRILGPERVYPADVATWWSRRLLRIFNVRVRYHGSPMTKNGHMKVANHVSWLDMFVLATRGDHRFVAKSEVANWPVASTLADAMDVVYIHRGRGGACPVIEASKELLSAGKPVLFFPEGTTTDGQQVIEFHARLFEAAAHTNSAVQAIAIQYRTPTGLPHIAPFIDDDSLVHHIWRLLKHPGFRVELYYSEPVDDLPDATLLAQHAQIFVSQTLRVPLVPPMPRATRLQPAGR